MLQVILFVPRGRTNYYLCSFAHGHSGRPTTVAATTHTFCGVVKSSMVYLKEFAVQCASLSNEVLYWFCITLMVMVLVLVSES